MLPRFYVGKLGESKAAAWVSGCSKVPSNTRSGEQKTIVISARKSETTAYFEGQL